MYKIHRTFSLIVISVLAILGPVYGQTIIPTLRFTTAQGLSSNTVYDVYRDSKGFLWISTDKGVSRYNGTKFETFTTKNGLSDNEVFFCTEDRSGKIWFATYDGTLCYFENGLFYNSNNNASLKLPFKKPFINRITVEEDSSLIINFAESGLFINIVNEHIKTFNLWSQANSNMLEHSGYPTPNNQKAILKSILAVRKKNNNCYIVSTYNTTIEVDSNSTIKSIQQFSEEKGQFPTFAQDQYYNVNCYGIYNYKNRELLKPFRKDFTDNVLKNTGVITRLYRSDSNYLIAVLKKGLYIADSICILPNRAVSSITQDTYHSYWIGTLDSGLYRIDKNFSRLRVSKNIYPGTINYCCIRNGQILFVNNKGDVYHFYNNHAVVVHHIANESPGGGTVVQPSYYIDWQYNLYSMAGTHAVTTNILSGQPKTRTYDALYDHGDIKMITPIGRTTYIQARRKIYEIEYAKSNPGSSLKYSIISDSANGRIYCMAASPDSSLWYSTVNNLYEIKEGQHISQGKIKDIPLKTFGFYCGYLVGYTHQNKLIICSRNGHGKIVVAGSEQDCIWGKFYQIDDSHVLIATNNYYRLLTLYATGDIPSYDITAIENPSIPINTEAICSDGKTLFFFDGGDVLSLDINILFAHTSPPQLYFDYLKSQACHYPINKEMKLTFKESRNILIHFTAVSATGNDVRYQYSISGDDADKWTTINSGEIPMINPAYGSYTVKIRAFTLSSGYSDPVYFELIIDKPFWLWWRFIALYTLVAAIMIVLLVKWRLKNALKKREQQHNIEVMFMRSEYKTLNALMNPHFIFNTLNNLQTLFNGEDKIKANKYLRIFANIIRQNMHNVSEELISIEKELELVNNYLVLEKLRFANRLNYTISIDEDIDLSEIMIPPLLLQPLVENSIKHGILPLTTHDGHIYVTVKEGHNSLSIEIKDNGVGLNHYSKQDSNHKSYGLGNIQKRIQQLNIIQSTSIRYDINEVLSPSGHHLWTIVTIVIPLL